MAAIKRITNLHRRRRGSNATASRGADIGQMQLSAIRYLVAQEVIADAELALRRGETEAAEQTIERAMSIDATSTRLTELRVWAFWCADRLDAALNILDTHPSQTPRLKLLRLMLFGLTGRREEARLELAQWSRQDPCPIAARALLALMEMDEGRLDAARLSIKRNLDRHLDHESLTLLVLIDLAEDLPDATQQAASQLGLWFAHRRPVQPLLASLSLRKPSRQASAPIEMVSQLAGELLRDPELIPTLVVAQRCRPNPARIDLLRRALARAVGDLGDPAPAYEALAELSQLAGDEQMARHWAVRGLKHHPYSATLALLLDRFDCPEQGDDAQVIKALRHVLKRHDYPDVREALMRRCRQAEKDQAA